MKKIRKFLIKNKRRVEILEFIILVGLATISYILSFHHELIWFIVACSILGFSSRKK